MDISKIKRYLYLMEQNKTIYDARIFLEKPVYAPEKILVTLENELNSSK